MFASNDPAGEWILDDGAWKRYAYPVYRQPQGKWVKACGFSTPFIWYVPESFDASLPNPNNLGFPKWLECYWNTQAGRWCVSRPGTIAAATTTTAETANEC